MRCHSCGTDVREGQKFCMECGASLRGVADVTGEVPVVRPGTPPPDEPTRPLTTPPPPPPPPPSTAGADDHTVPMAGTATGSVDTTVPLAATPPAAATDTTAPVGVTTAALAVPATRTHELRVIEATEAPADRTGEVPAVIHTGEIVVGPPTVVPAQPAPARRRFRLTALLLIAMLAAGATAVALLVTIIEVTPPPDGSVPEYAVNDFGTNNTIAGLIAIGAMVVGAIVWCTGHRWGAGLAGGAGAALAGWAALVIGAAEWRLDLAAPDADASRSLGYWALAAAGVVGAVALMASFRSAGRDRRNGLDPWIAALAAVSFIIAAGGPLIPEDGAGWASNWTGDNPGGLPTMFFVGRAVQLGLLVVCGVLGCLLVRRWGLGLAVGGALSAGWLLLTAATDRTDSPIGPGYSNPLFRDIEPHAVTVVGFALAGFFCLVAVVMALLDVDR